MKSQFLDSTLKLIQDVEKGELYEKESLGQVVRRGFLDMQICVPSVWTDEEAVCFANRANPSGLSAGWVIRKEGDEALAGCGERVSCEGRTEDDFVHITLDC